MGILGIGESDYKPGPAPAHLNPYEGLERNRIPGADTELDDLRNKLDLGVSMVDNRVAPQAGRVQLGYVPPAVAAAAPSAQLNTGAAMAPGMGIVGAGLGATAGALARAEQARNFQGYNMGLLGAAAAGAVPSAAEAQLQRGLDAGLRQNLALAASARGTAANQAAARRNALDANTSAVLQTQGQTSQLRAQEQAVARQQLTSALDTIRAQDLAAGGLGTNVAGVGTTVSGQGLQGATAQLGADTQTNLANLQANTQVGLGNLQAGTQLATAQLNADQAVSLANVDAQLKARGMDDQARLDYLGKLIGVDMATAEGQIKMFALYDQMRMHQQSLEAGISQGNAGASTQVLGALLGAGGTIGAAAATGGGKQ